MKYEELECNKALNKLKRKYPYQWDLNIYRGCEHSCKYCYAIYSHNYLNNDDFFKTIYYKRNLIKKLEQELSSPNWKKEIINIGGVTDSYQPIEKKLKIMPEVLKLMIKYKNPIIISTKSDLILRDIDLIKELSKITYVNIACTITTLDEKIRKFIEPNAVSSIDRFKVLKKIKENTNASTGVHIMPIIPYLTDSYDNLKEIYRLSNKINASYVLPGTLYLIGKTKPYFLESIKNHDYDKYVKISNMYQKGSASKDYKNQLYRFINELKKEYNISSNYMEGIKKVENESNNS